MIELGCLVFAPLVIVEFMKLIKCNGTKGEQITNVKIVHIKNTI